MTIPELMEIAKQALAMPAFPDPTWPPSVYYRFLGLVAKAMDAKVYVELGICGGGACYNVAKISPGTKVIGIDGWKFDQVAGVESQCSNFEFVHGNSIPMAEVVGPRNQPVDILFIDTIHEYQHTMDEFSAWLPYLRQGSIVFLDDLYRPGMAKVLEDLPYTKTGLHDLALMHLGGSPTDGGFGAVIINK